MNVVGKNGSHVLFSNDNQGVVIDIDENLVVEHGPLSALTASANWEDGDIELNEAAYELAAATITTLDVIVSGAGKRLYTIPKGAQEEAKRALEWRKEHKRGGTPVGLNTARTLAKGGQIGIEKVRHIAKYFPRHEVDKKAEGYSPGEDGFPSNGRIAWALWGGDTAWRWARAIVERENKKALKADGFVAQGYDEDEFDYAINTQYPADLSAFEHNLEAVEFIARMRMDGSGIDRLYKIDENYNVKVWDAGSWHSLEGVNQDLVSYDMVLDDESDLAVEKVHVEIDVESAFFLSACFEEDPFTPVSVFDIDYDEAELFAAAAHELDLAFLDGLVAAAENDSEGDGNYTPEERSEKASKQVRDKTGRFAKQGSRVVIGGDRARGSGNIIAIDPVKQSVRVKLDSGNIVDVPATSTEPESSAVAQKSAPVDVAPLDTSGILGEPRVPIDRPGAKIPGTLPAMTPEDMAKILSDYPGWVKSQRDAFEANPQADSAKPATTEPKPITGKDQIPKQEKSEYLKELEKLTNTKLILDPYRHPMLKDFINKKVKGSDGKYYYPNKMFYQPIVKGGNK